MAFDEGAVIMRLKRFEAINAYSKNISSLHCLELERLGEEKITKIGCV